MAGQRPSAQVAGACGTVYGSEGWGFESLRARHRLPRSQRWSLSGRVENLAELLHDEHGLALVVAELGDGKVGRWIGAPFRRSRADWIGTQERNRSIPRPRRLDRGGKVGGVPPDRPGTGCTGTNIGYGSGHSVAEGMLRASSPARTRPQRLLDRTAL